MLHFFSKKRIINIYYKIFNYTLGSYFARMRLFIIFIILVFVVLSVRLLYIYFWFNIDNKYNDTKSKYLYERRASIVDRNGVILARDTDAYDVYISLSKAFKLEEDLKKIKQAL